VNRLPTHSLLYTATTPDLPSVAAVALFPPIVNVRKNNVRDESGSADRN
jgi:hypothetical protein